MLNMDFSQRVVINTQQQAWQASQYEGVWRKPLAKHKAECGHATSIVRYEAGASLTKHEHPLGEEILVLEGTFSDKRGDFPIGSYLRNPDGYSHAPYSKDGCTLLVKLHQFDSKDKEPVHIDTRHKDWYAGRGNLEVMPLHNFEGESTALVYWPAGEHFLPHAHPGGEEIYVISGEFIDEHGRYPKGSWIRNPDMSIHNPHVEEDTLILVKVGHLKP